MEKNDQPVSIYELFILGLCIYVLAALAFTTFLALDVETKAILDYVDNVACAIFLADFVYKFSTAPNRLGYLKWGWIDLASSIPMVDALRWGRFARVFRVLRMLRAIRSARAIAIHALRFRGEATIATMTLLTILLITVSSITVLDFEREAGGNIRTAEDALWWSFVTITTVGYGDKFPVTTGGHIVAVVLMVAGVGVFGTVSGLFASWFMKPEEQSQDDELSQIRQQLVEVHAKLDALAAKSAAGTP